MWCEAKQSSLRAAPLQTLPTSSRRAEQHERWCPRARPTSDAQGLPADLLVDALEQVAADGAAELLVVEELGGQSLVLLHAADEEALKGLVEDDLESLQRVRRGCLLQLLVGDGLLTDLAEEELVGLGEGGAEALVDELDER